MCISFGREARYGKLSVSLRALSVTELSLVTLATMFFDGSKWISLSRLRAKMKVGALQKKHKKGNVPFCPMRHGDKKLGRFEFHRTRCLPVALMVDTTE
jgi:hypothetical protein